MEFSKDPPEPPPRRDTSTAWAAAAVVLGAAGLLFGVIAGLRTEAVRSDVEELSERLERLEGDATAPASSAITEVPDDTSRTPSTQPDLGSPGDPEAAKADIRSAFDVVYNGSLPRNDRLKKIDDPRGVDEGLVALQEGELAEYAETSRALVENVLFTSPTRASVTYSILSVGQPPQRGRRGEARVQAGEWKVVRSTICGDLAALGSPCG